MDPEDDLVGGRAARKRQRQCSAPASAAENGDAGHSVSLPAPSLLCVTAFATLAERKARLAAFHQSLDVGVMFVDDQHRGGEGSHR